MFKACFAAAALASAVQAFGQPAPGIYKVVSFNLQVDGQHPTTSALPRMATSP